MRVTSLLSLLVVLLQQVLLFGETFVPTKSPLMAPSALSTKSPLPPPTVPAPAPVSAPVPVPTSSSKVPSAKSLESQPPTPAYTGNPAAVGPNPAPVKSYSMKNGSGSRSGSFSGRSGSYSGSFSGRSGSYSGSYSGRSGSYSGSYSGSMRSGSYSGYSGSGSYMGSGTAPAPRPKPNVEDTPTMIPEPPFKRAPFTVVKHPTGAPSPKKSVVTTSPSLAPTSNSNDVNVPINFKVSQTFSAVIVSASGFSLVIQKTVNQLTGVPLSGVSSVVMSHSLIPLGGEEEGEEEDGHRELQQSVIVEYEITVTPKALQKTSKNDAYLMVKSALMKSVNPNTATDGINNNFTYLMRSIAKAIQSSGVSKSSSAVNNGITFGYFSSLPLPQPSLSPTGQSQANSNSAANSTLKADQTIGIIVGVMLVSLAIIAGLYFYRRQQFEAKDFIPDEQQTRDVSMTQMGGSANRLRHNQHNQQNHDAFDSEATSPTFSPVIGQRSNIIDIIPAKSNPLDLDTSPGLATRRL